MRWPWPHLPPFLKSQSGRTEQKRGGGAASRHPPAPPRSGASSAPQMLPCVGLGPQRSMDGARGGDGSDGWQQSVVAPQACGRQGPARGGSAGTARQAGGTDRARAVVQGRAAPRCGSAGHRLCSQPVHPEGVLGGRVSKDHVRVVEHVQSIQGQRVNLELVQWEVAIGLKTHIAQPCQ